MVSKEITPAIYEIIKHEIAAFTGHHLSFDEKRVPQHIDDLISAGHEALIRAAEKFDASRGFQFNTYAATCVRNAIRKMAAPGIRDAMSDPGRCKSIYDPIGGGDEGDRLDFGDTLNEEDAYLELPDAVWFRLQEIMPEREFDVIISRHAGYSRHEIAGRLGISAERVRQVEGAAFTRLEKLLREDSRARRIVHAPLYFAEQMEFAKSAKAAHQKSHLPRWADLDAARFRQERIGRLLHASQPQPSPDAPAWQEALVAAAAQAAIALGVNIKRPMELAA